MFPHNIQYMISVCGASPPLPEVASLPVVWGGGAVRWGWSGEEHEANQGIEMGR